MPYAASIAGSSSDLLLSRLRLRYAILLGTGIYALLVLIAEATVERGSRADGFLSVANDIGLFLLVGTISMMVLRVEPDLVRTAPKRPAAADPPTILEKRLEQLIEEEQVFMTEGLTIGALGGAARASTSTRSASSSTPASASATLAPS